MRAIINDGRSPLVSDLNFGGYSAVNLKTPQNSSDAATKAYVDANSGNFSSHLLTSSHSIGPYDAIVCATDGNVIVSEPNTPVSSYLDTSVNRLAAIQYAVDNYNNIVLLGDFSHTTSGIVIISRGDVNLVGVGCNLTNIGFKFLSSDNCSIKDITFLGNPVGPALRIFDCDDFQAENIKAIDLGNASRAAIYIEILSGSTNRNYYFNRCDVIGGGRFGWIITSAPTEADWGTAENFVFEKCRALGCGGATPQNEWVTGFDLSEIVKINHMLLRDCEASNCYESGFHMENGDMSAIYDDVVFDHCIAENNGTKTNFALGFGFLLAGNSKAINCISRNNSGLRSIYIYAMGKRAEVRNCEVSGGADGAIWIEGAGSYRVHQNAISGAIVSIRLIPNYTAPVEVFSDTVWVTENEISGSIDIDHGIASGKNVVRDNITIS